MQPLIELRLDTTLHSIPYYTMKFMKKRKKYINIPFSIDIETTSTQLDDGMEIAFPYLYQIGWNHQAYYTRDYQEFYAFMDRLNEWLQKNNLHIHCLIHNLSFEFTFFSGFMNFTDTFAKKVSQPVVTNYGNIRFLDSYLISGFNLSLLAKNYCKTQKLVGDIDFRKYHSPASTLTSRELAYAENDVIILNEYWDNYIVKNYINAKGFSVIPLTNTSKVRMEVKKRIPNKMSLYRILEKCYPDEKTISMLELAFQGGLVKSNVKLTNILLHNLASYDLTSSYPASMFKYLYPCSKFVKYHLIDFDNRDRDYGYLMKVHFNRVNSNKAIRTISLSKCHNIGKHKVDNGRIIYAEDFDYYCTDIDLDYILRFYDCDYTISYCERSKLGRLPRYLIETLIYLYKCKNELKEEVKKNPNDTDLAQEYLNIKGMLNSLYGMMVTKEHMINYIFDNGTWHEEINKKFHQLKVSDFVLYQWGVFVTSYSRAALMDAFLYINNDVVYGDTDSVKFINYEKYTDFFTTWNMHNDKLVKDACEYYHCDYKDMEGIGRWDFEGTYTDFKTLGSKRYYHDGHVTISGISEKAYLNYCDKHNINPLDFFTDGASIPAGETMKNTVKYFIDNTEPIIYNYTTEAGEIRELPIYNYIHISEAPWSMTMSEEYSELIKFYALEKELKDGAI